MENMIENTNHRHHRSKSERREHKKKREIRNIIGLVLSFLLAMVLFIAFSLLGIYIGVFNKDIVLNRLNQSNYYENIQKTIEDNVESILLPTGLPVTVLEDVISLDKVYINAKNYIENTFSGTETSIDTISIKNKIRENIEAYMIENNIEMTDTQDAGIIEISETVVSEYTRLLEFPFAKYFYRYQNIYKKIFIIAFPVLAIIAMVIMIILIKIHKWKHQAIRFIAFSDMAAALMLIIVPSILMISEFYKKIHVSPQYFYNFIVSYLQWSMSVFIYIGIGLVGVFILIIPFIVRLKKKKLK